ncbi:MAG: tetratricopeptide repeat protein, partial [Candidatus Muiribacteriota bacterium]
MDFKKMITICEAFFSQKEYDKVIDICLEILEHDKNNAQALTMIGDAYFQKGLPEGAVEFYKKIKPSDENLFAVQYKLALGFISQGKFKQALNILIKLAESKNIQDEDKARALGEISEIYYKNRDFNKAEEFIKKALKINENNTQYYQGLARLFYIKGKYDEAEKIYTNIMQKEGNIELDYILLSNIYIEKKDFSKAIEYLDKITETQHSFKSQVLKSFIFFITDDKKSFVRTVQKLFPELYEIKDINILGENIGLGLLKADEVIKSIEFFDKLEHLTEDEEEKIKIKIIKCGIYSFLNNNSKIKETIENIMDIEDAKFSAAQYFIEANIMNFAEKVIDSITETKKSNSGLKDLFMSYIERRRNNFDKALEHINLALKNANNPEFYVEKIELLWEMGKNEEAAEIAENLINKTENHVVKAFCNEILGDWH